MSRARILDEHGRYHGLRARIVRAFQQIGYDEETLETYDEALRHVDLLLHVPAPPADRDRIAALLHRHQVPALNRADLGQGRCPATARPRPGRVTWQHMVPVIPAVNRLDR